MVTLLYGVHELSKVLSISFWEMCDPKPRKNVKTFLKNTLSLDVILSVTGADNGKHKE